jgi:hypothetical protein
MPRHLKQGDVVRGMGLEALDYGSFPLDGLHEVLSTQEGVVLLRPLESDRADFEVPAELCRKVTEAEVRECAAQHNRWLFRLRQVLFQPTRAPRRRRVVARNN